MGFCKGRPPDQGGIDGLFSCAEGPDTEIVFRIFDQKGLELSAKTMAGLEAVLAEELEALGASNIRTGPRIVTFEGDKRLMYRANLELRTALRILHPIASFPARNEEQLYGAVRRIDWSQYMDVGQTLAVDALVNSSLLTHSKYVALKTKDAIVDQFRDRLGRRPSVNTENADLRINVRLHQDVCTISLDSSGESLHKRGYRTATLAAPVNEVLAAGMILLSGWKADRPFIDPMCGSGTLLIEAALLASRIPPQWHRRAFGFLRWPGFDAGLWKQIRAEAGRAIRQSPAAILGFDKDPRAVKTTLKNAAAAHLEGVIRVARQPFETLTLPSGPGLIMMNPPYDERLPEADIQAFYQMIGDRLKHAFPGCEAWIISSNKEALKHIGLRPSRKLALFNGPLECRFQRFDLYKGSKKSDKHDVE